MPTYRYTLTMLSPVHIGSGEELEPSEYVVSEKNGQYVVDVLDLPAFLASMTPELRRKFDFAVSGSALHPLRSFIREHCRPGQFRRYWCSTSCEFYERYRKGLQDDRSQLIVNRFVRNPANGVPYIPGSSLKGSIRTAVVNQAVDRADAGKRPKLVEAAKGRSDREFEPTALDYLSDHKPPEIRADPFRAVKISDAPLPSDAISIDPTQIFKPGVRDGAGDPGKIQMYHEMTFSALDDQEVTASGTIAIDERLARTPVNDGRWPFKHCVSQAINIEFLLQACRVFYHDRLKAEHEQFYAKNGRTAEAAQKLLKMAEEMKGHQALVRLGRFSHFECVTVKGFARKPPRGAGTTRTLAAGELPMGWARLTVEGIGR